MQAKQTLPGLKGDRPIVAGGELAASGDAAFRVHLEDDGWRFSLNVRLIAPPR